MSATCGPGRMPGQLCTVPIGQMCDTHSDSQAIYRVISETDMFGSEMVDMCSDCYTQYSNEMEASRLERATGTCDWCNNQSTTLSDHRDFEEGLGGKIYQVCKACIDKESARMDKELDCYDR